MQQDRGLIIAAFAAIYFIWGSTYLFNYWAIQGIPTFLMSGSRFAAAGLLLYAYGLLRREPAPTLRQWGNSFIIGTLFLSIGTGVVVWAMQYIDTGLTALIVAVDPLVIMFFLWVLVGQRPGWLSVFGAFLGIGGTVLLIGQPAFVWNSNTILGLVAIAVALVAWALGSIYVSRIDLPESRWRRSAMQMLGGGAGLLLYSLLSGELFDFSAANLTPRVVGSWFYLIFFGSIVGFSSFNFLLARVSPEKVATSTYVNPVVALLMGSMLNGEVITWQSIIAGLILLTGVFFINMDKPTARVAIANLFRRRR